MSSNRLIYEPCAFDAQVKQSTDPFKYVTNVNNYENNSRCGNKLEFGNRADIESELRGQTRGTTKCPCNKYAPGNSKVKNSDWSPPDTCNVTFGHMAKNDHKQKLPSDNGLNGPDANFCDVRKQ
jgi:hypothetical protein